MAELVIFAGLVVVAVWLFFTKPGKAELAILEARIKALEALTATPSNPPAPAP